MTQFVDHAAARAETGPLVGQSATVRPNFGAALAQNELRRTGNRRKDLRLEFQAVREMFDRGATSAEVIEWNNWHDGRSVRFQSCAAYGVWRDAAGRLVRRRVNMFG